MITIEELMTVKPYSLRQDQTLEDARQLMTEKHIRHVPITDDEGQLRGLVTQRDILLASNPQQPHTSESILLTEVMISEPVSIQRNASMREAGLFLQKHKYGCLPVVEEGRLVGIVTDSDFITVAINLMEHIELMEDSSDDLYDDAEFDTLPTEEEL